MEETLKKLLLEIKNIDSDNKLTEVQNENVLYLAYIGDTIFDLFTRDYLLHKYISKEKISELHTKNSNLVCAKSQARIVELLIDNNILTDDEKDFYRHARNAHSHSKSKNSSIDIKIGKINLKNEKNEKNESRLMQPAFLKQRMGK